MLSRNLGGAEPEGRSCANSLVARVAAASSASGVAGWGAQQTASTSSIATIWSRLAHAQPPPLQCRLQLLRRADQQDARGGGQAGGEP